MGNESRNVSIPFRVGGCKAWKCEKRRKNRVFLYFWVWGGAWPSPLPPPGCGGGWVGWGEGTRVEHGVDSISGRGLQGMEVRKKAKKSSFFVLLGLGWGMALSPSPSRMWGGLGRVVGREMSRETCRFHFG